MVLETKELINSGLNNVKEIKNILGPNNKLLDLVNGDYTMDDIKKEHYFDFNLYKAQYNLFKYVKIFTDTFNDEIDIIFNTNISYYDIILNIFFLTFVIIVGIIMYWDSVYRNARKNSRCAIIDNIINENNVSQSPYIYNIFIVNSNYEGLFKDKYLIKLTYDFITNTTTHDTKYIEDAINSLYYLKGAQYGFNYYNIELSSRKNINDLDKEKIKNDINNGKLSFIITDSKEFILSTDHSNALKDFVKKYYNDEKTSLEPIYNIKNAYNKNKSSDY
jgi:hypothetical protein